MVSILRVFLLLIYRYLTAILFIDSILDPEVSINELASGWLESYSENSDAAIKDLVNFILKVS